jgi:c-di-GMP-binding flagellar brake protein YcgR
MSTDTAAADKRSAPRVSCEHSAELLAADGAPHRVDLLNISAGGGQVGLSRRTAAALGLPKARTVQFRLWLPGDDEETPLEGEARVAYQADGDDAYELRLGLEFQNVVADGLTRVGNFVETLLRYAE